MLKPTANNARSILTSVVTRMAASATLLFAPYAAVAQESAFSVLPNEAVVRKVFENVPQLRSAKIGLDLAGNQQKRLEAGHYEWTARIGLNRRSDQLGERYQEQEFNLERPVRWFGKAEKDKALGAKGIEVAQSGYADVWHETSRSLMKEWFDAVKERAAVNLLRQQVELTEQLNAIAEKRVKAGDAARYEQLSAQTELQRVRSLLQQAEQREELALQILKANYPGLPLPEAILLPQPQLNTSSADVWMHKIMDDNHELELAQAEAAYMSLQAARVESDKVPDPTLGIRSSRERNGQEKIFGFSISMPFPGEARSLERGSAQLRAKMANEKLQQVQMKVTLAAQKAIADNQRHYANWQTLQSLRQQSQEQAQLMQTAYKLGELAIGDAINARKTALDAAMAADAAQIDALASYARLHLDAHLIWALD